MSVGRGKAGSETDAESQVPLREQARTRVVCRVAELGCLAPYFDNTNSIVREDNLSGMIWPKWQAADYPWTVLASQQGPVLA